ncbi:peptidylprolyl isomerase [Halomonas huangheensis]|uniref:peptidylprolyl isomerase n=1 Tax=Halomonas huangheensis TaxID=1178482 RepID=W1N2V5_9GAMM|nr:peptidylprolyl isomerase [Halomonas huangheensis]ALM52289.1 peptidylprolyl isomerase [Halomonas huangheensis]ERL49521.1 hypothetical protein BJB45_06990 [Halomonas huangheensis]
MQTIPLENVPADGPSIRVGDVWVEPSAIAAEMQFHPAVDHEAAAQAAARALVIQQLLRQRAAELGDQPVVDISEADIAAMLEKELAIPESDDEACRRYYAAHPERFTTPPRYQVRHILLAAAPDDAEARDAEYHRAGELIEALQQNPQRFTELAMRHSRCPSSSDGGELGWLSPGQTVEELDRALSFLPEGLHERPLASRYGWHVVQIDAREEGTSQAFDQVIPRVQHELRELATRMALRHYLLALEAEIGVEGFSLAETDGALMQ